MNKVGSLPTISIVMPCLNEERFIGPAISSLMEGEPDVLELIVVDGGSRDETKDIVGRFQDRGLPIRLLHNPKRRVSASMNIGIREARGEWIVRADAHCVYPPGYARRCVELLKATGAANVGGVQVPIAEKSGRMQKSEPCTENGLGKDAGAACGGGESDNNQRPLGPSAGGRENGGEAVSVKIGAAPGPGAGCRIQAAVAAAMRHPLGVGDARWRLGGRSGFVDTVYLGTFRRSLFDETGGYDEEADANQDAELNMRILAAGKTIYLDHTLAVLYYPRESFGGLARQYFRYGKGRARTVLKHRRLTSWRQAAAPLLLVGAAGSLAAAVWMPAFLFVPAAYAAALLAAALFSKFPDPSCRREDLFESLCRNRREPVDEPGSVDAHSDRTFKASEIGDPGENKNNGALIEHRLLVAAAWAVMHFSWGAGFLGGLIGKGRHAAPVGPSAAKSDQGANAG